MVVLKRAKKDTKIFVGLSGGVDSAVSAALLQKEGYDVTGVFIKIVVPGYPCTAGQDRLDAMRVAAHLKIPFIELDLSKEYEQEVFKESLKGFGGGQTPNPDAMCNRQIKFGAFYRFAKSRGADYIATGHYAQTKNGELLMGVDPEKDQSYFLWAVPQEVLVHTLFPVGGMQKPEVRILAKKFRLPNAERKDSQGLCFLGPISIGDMLTRELKPQPGKVLTERGEVIGVHDGAVLYTLGQRHGFTIHTHSTDSQPLFVVAKNIEKNTITVSPDKYPLDATRTKIALREENWIGEKISGVCQARFRYRQQLIPATLFFQSGAAVIELEEPYYVPLGQSLVLYKGERCVGGGSVDKCELA